LKLKNRTKQKQNSTTYRRQTLQNIRLRSDTIYEAHKHR